VNKIWIIAWHEYRVNIRRPGFIFMTLLVPLVGLISLLLGAFFGGQAGAAMTNLFEGRNRAVAVVDHSGRFTPILPAYADGFRLYASEAESQTAIQAGTVRRVFIIPADYVETGHIRVVSGEGAFSALDMEDSTYLRGFFTDHLARDLPDAALRARISDPFRLQVVDLDGQELSAGGMMQSALGFIVPYLLSILLIVTIFISSGYLLRSVSEEKTNRVIEIVLSSVTAQQLLAGKVLGLGALGIVNQAGHKLHLLLHPPAQVLHLVFGPILQLHPFQPGRRIVPGYGFAGAFQLAQVDQGVDHFQIPVESPLFGQIAHPLPHGGRRPAQHLHMAAVGLEDVHEDADGGRLARAVGSEHSENLAAVDGKGEMIHRGKIAVAFDQIRNFQHCLQSILLGRIERG